MTSIETTIADLPEKSLLLLDDDAPLRNRLGRALESRGFQTTLVESVSEALTAVRSSRRRSPCSTCGSRTAPG
jgi:two-component system response regulator RegA